MLKFGLSQKTGIDLPYEQTGNIPSVTALKNTINKGVLSYGYGFQATFMQILNAYSAFNNGGVIVQPRLIENLELNGKLFRLNESETKIALSKQTADTMKQILIKVVNEGTGKKAITPGLIVGGKTGTAHIAKDGGYAKIYNSSFFGFANDEKNSYTIGVFVRQPKRGSYYAAQTALPVFKETVDTLIKNGYLTPNLEEEATKIIIKDEKLDEIKD